MNNPIIQTLLATGFTFLMTAFGAVFVFLPGKKQAKRLQQASLGFAAGVMIAASVWSLIIPAVDYAESQGKIGWIPAAGGLLLGALFLFLLDLVLPHLHPGMNVPEGPHSSLKRTTLLVFAITMHNIPEGMAVGLAFALSAQQGTTAGTAAAIALAIGIGIQNFPEGAAVAMPLRQEGMRPSRAFALGALSGFVEPVFGLITVLVSGAILHLIPWFLSFAAGAMLFVVAEELIPESQLGEHPHYGTAGLIFGFIIMMVLDISLG